MLAFSSLVGLNKRKYKSGKCASVGPNSIFGKGLFFIGEAKLSWHLSCRLWNRKRDLRNQYDAPEF